MWRVYAYSVLFLIHCVMRSSILINTGIEKIRCAVAITWLGTVRCVRIIFYRFRETVTCCRCSFFYSIGDSMMHSHCGGNCVRDIIMCCRFQSWLFVICEKHEIMATSHDFAFGLCGDRRPEGHVFDAPLQALIKTYYRHKHDHMVQNLTQIKSTTTAIDDNKDGTRQGLPVPGKRQHPLF